MNNDDRDLMIKETHEAVTKMAVVAHNPYECPALAKRDARHKWGLGILLTVALAAIGILAKIYL